MKQIRLALSGSGFLAPIHAGAICAFMDASVQIVEIAGTSGGSIAAALVASGKTSAQIKAASLADLPEDILTFNPLALPQQGYSTGNSLVRWLHKTIGPATFGEESIPCTIMATDINEGKEYKFDSKGTPGVQLADACRASASVPFVYVPANVNGTKLIDGGVCCNIPVDKLVVDSVPRIGIEVVDGTPAGATTTFLKLAAQCLSTLMASNEDNLTEWAKQTGATILLVNATPYGFLNPALDPQEKTDLFNRGYSAARAQIGKM